MQTPFKTRLNSFNFDFFSSRGKSCPPAPKISFTRILTATSEFRSLRDRRVQFIASDFIAAFA